MKKITSLFILSLMPFMSYAQTDNPKLLSEDIVRISLDLAKKDSTLQAMQAKVKRLEKRSENMPKPQDFSSVANRYNSVEEMYKDREKIVRLPQDYAILFKMYNAYTNGCTKAEFEGLKEELANFSLDDKAGHTEEFKKDFEKTKVYFNDYVYTMSELARLFKIVDTKTLNGKKVVDGLYKQLQEEGETYYVDLIPYTKGMLEKYINAKVEQKKNITGTEEINERKEISDGLANNKWPGFDANKKEVK